MKKTKEEVEKQTESIANTMKDIFIPKKEKPMPISPEVNTIFPKADFPKVILIKMADVQSVEIPLFTDNEIDFEPSYYHIVGFLIKETEKAYYISRETGAEQYKIRVVPKSSAIVEVKYL